MGQTRVREEGHYAAVFGYPNPFFFYYVGIAHGKREYFSTLKQTILKTAVERWKTKSIPSNAIRQIALTIG